ncbi:hypothetical protein ACQ9LF_01560 [Anaerohalosphaeraceae bacterium U12dextr]
MASCDIGALGPKEGQPILYYWSPLYAILGGLFWVPLVLGYVLFKENRRLAALWILLPAAGFRTILWFLAALTDMSTETSGLLTSIMDTIAVSFCLVWLLAGRIGGRHRFVTAVLALLIFAGMAGLAVLTLLNWDNSQYMTVLTMFTGISFGVYTIALTIATLLSRKRMTGLRFSLWSIPGCLIGTAIPFSVILIIEMMQYPDEGMVWQFLLQTLVGAAFFYAALLPFLILFFVNGFWRQRFEAICLRKKPAVAETAEFPPQI